MINSLHFYRTVVIMSIIAVLAVVVDMNDAIDLLVQVTRESTNSIEKDI